MLTIKKQGRRKDEIWSHFTKGEKLNSSHYEAKCMYCNLSVCGINKIMTRHLQLECPEILLSIEDLRDLQVCVF